MTTGAPRIAIIGAGPAGSTLGRLLHLAEIRCVIFEAEASANTRTQGGTLDLHTESGLAALKKCHLYDQFLKYARYDGEAMILVDKDFRSYIRSGPSSGESKYGRPEIDREKLRKILLESLPADMVNWGKKLARVDDLSGQYELIFEDGTKDGGFDLVVGADGAFSKVRALLSSETPAYAGIGGLYGLVPDAEKRHPELYKRVNRGSFFAFSDRKSIIAQQLGDGSINVGASWIRPHDWIKEHNLDTKEPSLIKAEALKQYQDWDSRLTAFVEAIDSQTLVNRNLYMLPVGHKWKHHPGVTLVGDAAHLMTPYAGEGVNLAMSDSMKLAEAIIEATKAAGPEIDTKHNLDSQIKLFEEGMFKRATFYQGTTKQMMDCMFNTPGAPYTSIERYVLGAISNVLPWGTLWLGALAVHTHYFFYKRFFLKPEPK